MNHTAIELVVNFKIVKFMPNHALCLISSLGFLWQMVLFGEIILAQKVMYEKFGNAFLVQFVSKGLRNVHCSEDLAEQYYQKLQVPYTAFGTFKLRL